MNVLKELDNLEERIKNPLFRNNERQGNEVGYYIFHYDPEDELTVRKTIISLSDKINKGSYGFSVTVFDLYEILIGLIKEKRLLDSCFKMEKEKGFTILVKELTKFLRIDSGQKDGPIIKYFRDNTLPDSGAFLTGVGKCYPVISSHDVLNNLHAVVDNVPVILFYPGKFDGQQLTLFNIIASKNYYRAFTLN
jgi:hypothetical protein